MPRLGRLRGGAFEPSPNLRELEAFLRRESPDVLLITEARAKASAASAGRPDRDEQRICQPCDGASGPTSSLQLPSRHVC